MNFYYNEINKYAAEWLRNLIAAGLVPPGDVDERSIVDVQPDDLRGYVQCHFFAGIGGWAYAARLAGWPDDRELWTGSCPCQPFSSAGGGDVDSRTLGTCGPSGIALSPSGVLQQSWVNSLRARLNGSPLCEVNWKPWVTPWGVSLSKPRASELNSCGTAIGLLPALTSKANMFAPSMQKWRLHRRLLPALTARDWKSSSPGRQGNSRPLSEHIPGPINPMWAASHMGFPPEWNACAPTATRSSRKSPQK